jgi:transketolase
MRDDVTENRSARGAYRLREASNDRKVVLLATGSEVHLAAEVADRLEADRIGADVVSMPCWELFEEQDEAYRNDILGQDVLRVSIEAGATLGWERYTGSDGLNFGIDRFGASAPAPKLFEYFGLTADAIAPQISKKLS